MEKIVCAAIHYDDDEAYPYQPDGISSGFVLSGRRHSDIIRTAKFVFDIKTKAENVQGFLTSYNRFVDRWVGAEIAVRAKQVEEGTNALYSEDLY